MPAKKTDDQNPFGDGELSQELIDAMLNGGGGGDDDAPAVLDIADDDIAQAVLESTHDNVVQESPQSDADPWADETLQAEINAARLEAGLGPETDDAPFARPAAQAPAPAQMPTPMPERRAPAPSAVPTAVHPVQFMPLTPEPPSMDHAHGIELLMDVALEVSVELGRSHMSIGEILALRTGSVIELDKLAGEPVDVSVNGTLIARGEVVVVDEKFGVRITEVVSKARRLASVG
jgi:flagellar motor switch protein FliN/FliY